MSQIVQYNTSLKMDNGSNISYSLSQETILKLRDIAEMYAMMPEYIDRGFRANMIKTAVSDISIESKEETTLIESLSAIMCNKIKNKEQQSAINMINMLESGILDKQTKMSEEYLIEIWRNLTFKNRNLNASIIDTGYRKTSVKIYRIGLKNISVVHKAPDAKHVRSMMNDLVQLYNSNIHEDMFINAIIKSAIFSAYFVYVHPFLDGNGRTSRLLTNKLLIDSGLSKFRYLSISAQIVKSKKEYGAQLEKIEIQNNGDLTEFIEFMVNLFDKLFSNMLDKNKQRINVDCLNNRQKIMLKVIQGSEIGTFVRHYKDNWNCIAKERGYDVINTKQAEADLNKLLLEDFIVIDERYIRYPGFKFYRN